MTYAVFLILILSIFTLITWRDVRFGLTMLTALLPVYLLRFSIFGIPSTLLEAMVGVLVVVWIIRQRPDPTSIIPSNWTKPLIFFLATATIGVWISPNTMDALGVFKAYFIEPILVFLVACHVLKTTEQRANLLIALGVSAIVISVFGIAQYITGYGIPIPWDIERRITGFYPFPNALGLILGPIIVIGAGALLFKKTSSIYKNIFWSAVVIFSTTTVILAKSEAVLVAAPSAIFILALFSKRWRIPAITTGVVLSIVMAVSPFWTEIWQKITLQDASGQVRIAQWKETWELLKNSPVFGSGLSGYPTEIADYHTHTEYEIFQYPHNILLNIWVEIGIPGIIAVAWIGKRILQTFKHALQTTTVSWPVLVAGAALFEMIIHGLVDVPYFKNDLAVLTWILIGVIISSNTHVFQQTDKR